MNYLDTSAIIKRFVNEQGSEVVDGIMTGPEPVATAKVAFAEALPVTVDFSLPLRQKGWVSSTSRARKGDRDKERGEWEMGRMGESE